MKAQQIKCTCGRVWDVSLQGKKNTTWKPQVQAFRLDDAGKLRQLPPRTVATPAPPRSQTKFRLDQAFALTGAIVVGGWAVFYSPFPNLIDFAVTVGAGVFALSVALGKENQDSLGKLGNMILKWLDRNKDGSANLDDFRTVTNDMREKLDNLSNRGTLHEPGPDIQYSDNSGTRFIAGLEPPIERSLIIRVETIDQPALVVDLDTLCSFIRAAVGVGKWTRRYWTSKERKAYKISQDTWEAYRAFFSRRDVGLWEIDPPTPVLPGVIADFRQWATNQPTTNQPTG